MKRKAIDAYGMEAFKRVAGGMRLRKRLDYWLTKEDVALDYAEQVEDAADSFLAHHRYDFEPDPKRASSRIVIKGAGSLARVGAYAEALPAVLKAREAVLGTREPLSHAGALDWLRRETQSLEERSLVEVRFRFLVPKYAPVLWSLHGDLRGPELLAALDEVAVHKAIALGAEQPAARPTETSLTLRVGLDNERIEIDLLSGDSEKLDALLRWAQRLAGRCVGGASSEHTSDYPEALGAAVWLILAGIWPRVSVDATIYPRRGWALVPSEEHPRPQVPYMLIRVDGVDTPADVVSRAYQSLRNGAKLSMAGRTPEPESEILCMAALDVQEIDGIGRASPGFLDAVLRRYRAKAKEHGVKADAFPDTPGGRDRARRALARADRTYRKLHPGHALLDGFDSER